MRVCSTGKKTFIYRHFVGTSAKFHRTLGELFDAHETVYKASGKRAYHHFITCQHKKSGLLPESTIANRIGSNDCREYLSWVYKITGKRRWVNATRSYLPALFGYGTKCDKSPDMDVVNLKFDIPFNSVSAIPTLECDPYVGDRYLSNTELAELMNDAHSGKYFNPDLSVFIQLAFFTCGQRPYEITAMHKEHYNRDARMISFSPDFTKTKKWYHIALCDSAIALLDEMCARYPDGPYISADVRYEEKLARWKEKERTGKLTPESVFPTPFIGTDIIGDNIRRYRKHRKMEKFTPRDFRRTFKTPGAEIKLSKEIRDRIQNHCQNDISNKHYDRYDYFEEKFEAVMVWGSKLKEIMNN